VSDIEMSFSMDFELESTPEWFSDSGTAEVNIKRTSLDMVLNTINQGGVLQVDFSEVDFYIQDYDVKVNGATDLSAAIEIILNNFKTFFRTEITKMLAWRAAKSAEEALNRILFDQGEILALNEDRTIHLNTTLVSDIFYHDGFFTVALDGTFATQHAESDLHVQHQQLPLFVSSESTSAQIMVFLSEYTLNTAFETVHRAGMIEFTTKVTSTYLKTFFKNWEEVMGKNSNINMVLQSQSAPRLEVSQSVSHIYTDALITIKNPFSDEYDVVSMAC
jgi:hypothetical protein